MKHDDLLKSLDTNFVTSILDTMFKLTEIIHFETDLNIIFYEVIEKISMLYDLEYGELWVFGEVHNELSKSPIYYSKSIQSKCFGEESENESFALNVGIPGRTWKQKEPIWTQNVQNEPTFIRIDLAKKYGLKTCVSIPILAYDHVETVLMFFSCEELDYDPLMVQILDYLARNIGLMIIKTRLEQQISTFKDFNDYDRFGYPLLERLFSFRDPYTMDHQLKVAKIANDIALKLGCNAQTLSHIRTAAMIHDIGKINVPMEILAKPGKLTQQEFNLIYEHPKLGYEIIKNLTLHPSVKRIVLEHHERIDGSGYPNHLKDQEILQETKILTVADVISAMLENRPYRKSLSIINVRKELSKFRGIYYSPEIVDVALELLKDGQFIRAAKSKKVV